MKILLSTLAMVVLALTICGCDDDGGGDDCSNTACRDDCRDDGYANGHCDNGRCICVTGGDGDADGDVDGDVDGDADCDPACAGRECGPDGCGGSCGGCPPGYSCSGWQCVEEPCIQECDWRECGPDPECGEPCGTCDLGEECSAGTCVTGTCTTRAGTYPFRLVENDGFCPQPIVDNMEALRQELTFDGTDACDYYEITDTQELEGTTCLVDILFGFWTSEAGPEEGMLWITIRECGLDDCMHGFDMVFL